MIRFIVSKKNYLLSVVKIKVLAFFGFAYIGKNCRFDQKAVFDFDGMNNSSLLILGNNTHIKKYAIIAPRSGKIKIGSNVNINPYCFLYGYGDITIGNFCRIAAGCKLIAFNHNFSDKEVLIANQGNSRKGIIIGNNVWLGADVKVLDGVTIGSNTIVGAGSVVTKSLPSNVVASGVPAQIKRLIE